MNFKEAIEKYSEGRDMDKENKESIKILTKIASLFKKYKEKPFETKEGWLTIEDYGDAWKVLLTPGEDSWKRTDTSYAVHFRRDNIYGDGYKRTAYESAINMHEITDSKKSKVVQDKFIKLIMKAK